MMGLNDRESRSVGATDVETLDWGDTALLILGNITLFRVVPLRIRVAAKVLSIILSILKYNLPFSFRFEVGVDVEYNI